MEPNNTSMDFILPLIGVLVGIIAVILIIGVVLKNGIIAKSNQVENTFSTVDVMLKKRFDLLPQLTECVKGYMKHEEELLTKLTALRSTPREAEALAGSNFEFTNQLQQFIIKAEAYPDLKASDQFLLLQRSINETEEQLAASRRTFNAAIEAYNNAVMQFPSSVIARRNNFGKKTYFEFKD